MNKNFGLLKKSISPRDWVFGSNTPLYKKGKENPIADWKPFTPIKERQSYRKGNNYVDTMACVSFSALNAIETVYRYKFNKQVDYSDRALAKLSETTKWGNYLYKVANCATEGLINELKWYYPDENAKYTWDDYYKEIPEEIINERKYHKASMEITHEWVEKKDFIEALRYSPIQVTCYAWAKGSDGKYYMPKGSTDNHAILLVSAKEGEYWEIFDSYPDTEGSFFKKLSWDNIGEWGKVFYVNHKNKPMEFQNNTLLQLVEGKGGFGLWLDGRIIVDDLAKIQATFIVRNKGVLDNKVASVRQDWWDEQEKVDLKGNKI